jgi:spermidine/putrescine transport system substrate-binding protein
MTEPNLLATRLNRRSLLSNGARGAAAFAGISVLGTACGGSSSSGSSAAGSTVSEPLSGTINLLTYADWIGKNEYANFAAENPGVKVHEVADTTSSTRGKVVLLRQNPGAYDMLLLGLAAVPDIEASPSLVAPTTESDVPNLKLIPDEFRSQYTSGIPTDYGKIGFAYRNDLMSERPTTWAEVWQLAPKYSGKIIFLDVMEDCMGNTLTMLGYDGNSLNGDEINQARDKLLEIKPHWQALTYSDVAKPLVQGTAVLAMDWDFDIANAARTQPNITWVAPEEGMMAYLEGWTALKDSTKIPEVHAFMNFHLEPKNYADFVNTTGTAYLEPAATPLIRKQISNDPILAFDQDTVSKLTFEKTKGQATELWTTAWNEVHAG